MDETPTRNADLTPVRYVGADNDFLYFVTESWTGDAEDGKAKEYDLSIDKRDGSVTCSCPDANFRGKVGHVQNPRGGYVCKHASRLMQRIEEILKEGQEPYELPPLRGRYD